MTRASTKNIKLRRITIKNYKSIDELTLEFPAPRFEEEDDIFVIGSSNGVGKTSVLECCALLWASHMAACIEAELDEWTLAKSNRPAKGKFEFSIGKNFPIQFSDIIRAGAQRAEIAGVFSVGGKEYAREIILHKNNRLDLRSSMENLKNLWPKTSDPVESVLSSLFGINPEPMVCSPFLYMHSYRKIKEGDTEILLAGEGARPQKGKASRLVDEKAWSSLKYEIVKMKMAQANLFDYEDAQDAGAMLDKMNQLLEEYAGATLSKLKAASGNEVGIRVLASGKEDSYGFDGLSSGQKEIISAFFSLWRHTRYQPGIILIDEPELHLNAEWKCAYIHEALKLSPGSQFIIATHSEDIFGAVPANRRIMLMPSGEKA
ncbi:MAG: AAA family ATPase [Candidatus Sumerlaeota bacterium]|nr:AAA family ATPase [Candidatus Sumerlaeota bacterium]